MTPSYSILCVEGMAVVLSGACSAARHPPEGREAGKYSKGHLSVIQKVLGMK